MRELLSTTLDMAVVAEIFEVQMLDAPQSFWCLHAPNGDPEHWVAFIM